MSFVPLRVHSQWSLLAGVPTVSELVAHAQANDLCTLALTDANALYGAIEFVRACRAANLRSILGVDFTFDRDHTLVLLARNLNGYANLCRLVTRLQATPDREAALQRGLSLIDLAEHSRDLIALSDGHQAEALRDLFGHENVFISVDESNPLDLPVVALPDIRYLDPSDAARYRVLTAMRTGQTPQCAARPARSIFLLPGGIRTTLRGLSGGHRKHAAHRRHVQLRFSVGTISLPHAGDAARSHLARRT